MNRVSTFSQKEREETLRLLKLNKNISNKLLINLKLALFDESAWIALIQKTAKAQTTYSLLPMENSLGLIASRMPEKLKKTLSAKIDQYYAKSKSSHDGHWAPKRDLDYLIHAIFDGGSLIKQELNAGRSPIEAYQKYLSSQKKLFFKNSDRGNYSAIDVLNAAKILQSHLKAKNEAILGGSFVAGRASLKTSDIDFSTNGYPDEDKLNLDLEEYFSSTGKKIGLHFERFNNEIIPKNRHTYPGELASSSPVLIHVTSREIELYVYDLPFKRLNDPESFSFRKPLIVPLK